MVAALAIPSAARADTIRVVVSSALIWSSAGDTVPVVLTQVPEGTILEVRRRVNDWYEVVLPPGSAGPPGTFGYIRNVQVAPEPADGPTGASTPAEPMPQPAPPPLALAPVPPSALPPPLPRTANDALSIPHVATAPTLTAMREGTMPEAVVVSDFRQKEPSDGIAASLQTTAYVSYDDKNLYVTFDCADDPTRVRASLAKREDISDDDQVLVYLDTFHDRRRAYVFASNALGVQRDGIVTEGQGTDYSYDTVWRSEARLDDRGYTVMIAIPFKSLRFSNEPVQNWGIALGRYVRRKSEYAYWPYITSRVGGFVNQMADLRDIRRVSPGRNIQLVPYGAMTSSRFLDSAVPAFKRSDVGRGGLDSKIVIKDAFALDATVNPDFSQVESDEPQVTVNKRFEVFFPEKRPFFIENAGFFETPETLFFSRRIIDPEFGARLTGKAGPWAIGALVTDDRAEGQRYAAGSPLAGRRTAAAVVRVQREIGKESYVGALMTERKFAADEDRALSVDMRVKLSPTWVVSGQVIQSANQSSTDRSTGHAFNAALSRSGRHFSYSGSYFDRNPDFDVPLGFVKRVDIRETDHYVSYFWRPKTGPLIAVGPSVSGYSVWDYTRTLQDWYAEPEMAFYFRRPFQVKVSHSESYEAFSGQEFRERSNHLSVYSAHSKRLVLNASVAAGKSPNYSPPSGTAPFLADSQSVSAGFTFRPVKRLRLDESYYYSRLSTSGADVYTNHISRTKLNFQFTRDLSVRAIADYNAVVPTALIRQSLSKRLTGDLLFTYLINPFTAVYVGYTERYQNVEIDPIARRLRAIDSPSTLVSRQGFLKISYRFGL